MKFFKSLIIFGALFMSANAFGAIKGVELTWPANPAGENITAYTVLFHHNGRPARPIYEVAETRVSMSLDYLSASVGDEICFSVVAKSGSEQGPPSDKACAVIPDRSVEPPTIKIGISQVKKPIISFSHD